MILNYDSEDVLKQEFQQKMKWFEDEFDIMFQNSNGKCTEHERKLAGKLLNNLSEAINEFKDETLLYDLVTTLNNIERKHPEFF